MDRCIFCGEELIGKNENRIQDICECSCPVCGKYRITYEALKDFVKSKFKRDSIKISCYLKNKYISGQVVTIYYDCGEALKEKSRVCFEDIIKQFPHTLSDRIDASILNIAKLSKYNGDYVNLNKYDYPIFYPDNKEEEACFFIMEQLYGQNLIENENKNNVTTFPSKIRLTFHGWEKVIELQKGSVTSSRNVFIGMWFDSSMTKVYREGIEKAIIDTGYEPIRVDQEEYNEKICDRIIADIRKCRFAVFDFTGHRGGVYFEAGFAMGLGKPVIWLCREDEIKNCHFDTRQYNHIVWKNENELCDKLKKRIEATIY